MSYINSQPFESRYKMYKILNYGNPYSDYKTYNIKYHKNNTSNILAIYVDNQSCNNVPTNKSSLCVIDENAELLFTNLLKKHFVEIYYTLEQNKPKLEYIMTIYDINALLSKYGYVFYDTSN